MLEGTTTGRSGDRVSTRTGRVVGMAEVIVGEVRRTAIQVEEIDTLTGGSNGITTVALWLDPATGLSLRWRTDGASTNSTAIGEVGFEEHVELTLRDLDPKA